MTDKQKINLAETILEILGDMPVDDIIEERDLIEWAQDNGYVKE